MKTLLLFSLLLPTIAVAQTVECTGPDLTVKVVQEKGKDLVVIYKGEAAEADGILTAQEVDLVAKFESIGEMTLFAKVRKEDPENYMFAFGKRKSVSCR